MKQMMILFLILLILVAMIDKTVSKKVKDTENTLKITPTIKLSEDSPNFHEAIKLLNRTITALAKNDHNKNLTVHIIYKAANNTKTTNAGFTNSNKTEIGFGKNSSVVVISPLKDKDTNNTSKHFNNTENKHQKEIEVNSNKLKVDEPCNKEENKVNKSDNQTPIMWFICIIIVKTI